jgi:hypothetical protein
MTRFIFWVLGSILAVGVAPRLIALTLRVAEMAVEAQSHDQMSYAKFNRALWTPRKMDAKSEANR